MTIAAQAPRGGLAEQIGDATHVLVLRNGEIERFEDKHRGIFELWDGFYNRGPAPSSQEVRDLIALGLVGGGAKDGDADRIVTDLGPDQLLGLFLVARALLGVAFMPDAGEEKPVKKKGKSRAR